MEGNEVHYHSMKMARKCTDCPEWPNSREVAPAPGPCMTRPRSGPGVAAGAGRWDAEWAVQLQGLSCRRWFPGLHMARPPYGG